MMEAKHSGFSGYFPCWKDEIEEGFVASNPIMMSSLDVITRNDNTKTFTDLEDLFKNNIVGVVRDYGYSKDIVDLINKYPTNVVKAPTDENIVRMLIAGGRFDFGLTDIAVAKLFDTTNMTKHVRNIDSKPLHIAVKVENGDTTLLDIVNNALLDNNGGL